MNLYLLIYIYIYIYIHIYIFIHMLNISQWHLWVYCTRQWCRFFAYLALHWHQSLAIGWSSFPWGTGAATHELWCEQLGRPSTANNARPHAWTIRKSVHSGNRERRHGYTVSSTMGVQVMWQSRLCGSDISRSWLRFFFYNSSYKRSLLLRKHSLFYNGMLFGCDSALVQLRKCMW